MIWRSEHYRSNESASRHNSLSPSIITTNADTSSTSNTIIKLMITRSTSKSKSKPNKQSNSQERTSSTKTRSSRRVRFDREQDIVQTNNSNQIEICDKCKSID